MDTLILTQDLIDYLKEHLDDATPGSTVELNADGGPKDPTQPPKGPGH